MVQLNLQIAKLVKYGGWIEIAVISSSNHVENENIKGIKDPT